MGAVRYWYGTEAVELVSTAATGRRWVGAWKTQA